MTRRVYCVFLVMLMVLPVVGCSGGAGEASNSPKEEAAGAIAEKTVGESIAVEVNSQAPAFAAKVMGGGELRLSDYVGKVVLLEFWSIFCKSCLQEMPAVKELHNKYGSQGFEVISVNTDAFSDARVLKVLEKAGLVFDYPVIRDIRREVSQAYNVEVLPVTVIIDRSGWIRLYQEGYRPGEEAVFEKTIVKYLNYSPKDDVTLAPRGGVTRFAPKGSRQVAEEEAKVGRARRTTLAGKEIVIGDRPAALFFWSLYCQPCREELPELEKLRARWSERGVDFIAVNVDSPKLNDKVVKFLKPYPTLDCVNDEFLSSEPNLSSLLGIEETPTTVLIDAKGKIVHVTRGYSDASKLEAELGNLLKR